MKDVISDLVARLIKGSRKSGLRLTANECVRFAAALKPKRGRPPDNLFAMFARQVKRDEIGSACVERELQGMGIEEAKKATAKEYKVSISTVRDLRRHFRIPGRRKRPNIDYLQLPTNK
jgi:hypothetical protein